MPVSFYRLCWCLLLAISFLSTASAESLRIVTWNLEWFPGNRPGATPAEAALQMQRAQKALAELNPDVLLLQEVRDWAAAQELCKAVPGLNVHVVSHFKERTQNLVVAGKLPADSGWYDSWKVTTVEAPRGYAFAALQIPGGKFLLSYSLHLKSNRGDINENISLRHEATRQLLPHIQEMLGIYSQRGPCGVVVGGDFNTSLDDERFKPDFSVRALIKAGMHWTHEGVPFAKRVTIPAEGEFPDNTFDHILTAGFGKPSATIPPLQPVSDHNPVILDVDFSAGDFAPKLDIQAGLAILPDSTPVSVAVPAAPVEGTLRATDNEQIKAAVGKSVAVRGKVSTVGSSRNNTIYFINFEGTQRGQFVTIVRKQNYEAVVKALGVADLKALEGKEIEVHGEVSLFQGTPQIELKQDHQLIRVP